jgi:D-methionine transport system ATP-binding protein
MHASLRLSSAARTENDPLLSFHEVRKIYSGDEGGEAPALDGVTLDLAAGEILAVIGASGAGKSTLARLAAGLDSPTSGRISLGGVNLEADTRRRRAIAMLGPDPDLPPSRTVRDIIEERVVRSGAPQPEAGRALAHLIDLLDIGDDADRRVETLPRGRRRRAALARALAGGPSLLVLDEATSALDPEMAAAFLALISRVNADSGLTVVLVTHDMAAVTALARRVAVLENGRVVEEGPTAQLFSRPGHPVTRRFAASATGATLPPFIASKLLESPAPNGRALIRLAFEGEAATRPVLTQVARDLGFDLGIVAGSLGAAGGEPYGELIVAAPSDEPYFTASVERLEDAGVGVEVLGFVV